MNLGTESTLEHEKILEIQKFQELTAIIAKLIARFLLLCIVCEQINIEFMNCRKRKKTTNRDNTGREK